MNERKIGIILSYFNIILQVLIGFIYVPILLKYIGQSEYGLYQLMGSIVAYFGIMDFGLTTSTIRGYIKYKTNGEIKRTENFLAITQRLYFFICVLMLIIGSVVYNYLDDIFINSLTMNELLEAKKIFILLIFNIIITFLGMIYRSIIIANEKFLFFKTLEVLQLIAQPFIVIAIIQIWPVALAIVVVMTILNIIMTIFRVYYCYNKLSLKINYYNWDKEAINEMKKLSISVFVVAIIDQIFWKSNQIILGVISGVNAVAIYSIASLIYMNYMALSTAITGIYSPKIMKMVSENVNLRDLSKEFLRIGRLQYYVLALILSGFFVFGRDFIIIWCNDNFIDAYYITLIIIIPFTIDLIQNIGAIIMKAKNIYGFRAKVYFIIGIINICLSIPLAKIYGGIGCAVACGLSILISNVVMNIYFKRVLFLDIILFWKQILKITINVFICIMIGLTINYFFEDGGLVVLIIKLLVFSISYFFIMWKLSFNYDEKLLIFKLRAKIIR